MNPNPAGIVRRQTRRFKRCLFRNCGIGRLDNPVRETRSLLVDSNDTTN
jgi:hypothetical protein